ncbi:MAG: sugar phosphate isomerase/epimerase [Candidatus Firestonebacteria bacterium]
MKIGYVVHPRKDIVQRIKWISKNNFDFVDFFMEDGKSSPKALDFKKVKKVLKDNKIPIVGHTAWYLPLAAPSEALRKTAVNELKTYIRALSRLGAKYITIHTKWPHGLFSAKEGILFHIKSLKELMKTAQKYKVKLMLEQSDHLRDSPKNISAILKKVPGLYFHLDIGHANLHRRNPADFIKKFRTKIKHLHLHDNHGKLDEHLPLGKGNINFKKIIKLLRKNGYDGTLTLEVFSKHLKDILTSKRKIEHLLN